MQASKTLSILLLSALTAACGGGEDMGEAPPATTDVVASGAPECYVAGDPAELAERPSPLRQTELSIELGAGLLCYGAPSANGREVMGALVPYGQPWRVGANEATTVHLTYPASIGGVALEPGSYSIYAVPGEGEWEFFINSSYERWGVPISDEVRASEIGSFTVTPTPLNHVVETLQYRFEPSDDNTMGDIVMEWDETQLRFPLRPGG